MDVDADATSRLGDESALLERVVDALDAVIFHGQQEATRQLRFDSGSVEEGGGGMSEVALGQQVVRDDGGVNVLAVNADSDTHEHVLRTLGHFVVDAEQVGSFQGLVKKLCR